MTSLEVAVWIGGSRSTAFVPMPTCVRLRVLVVDDDLLTLNTLERILVRAGHEVSLLDGGFGFAVALHQFKPDVVLLDMNMPGLTGAAALTSARELATLGDQRPRIILHSGKPDSELQEMCKALRADGYVRKPASSATLLEAIAWQGVSTVTTAPSEHVLPEIEDEDRG